jgi:hypothetical protein
MYRARASWRLDFHPFLPDRHGAEAELELGKTKSVPVMKTRYCIIALASLLLGTNTQAQQTLADLVQEANAGWMMGTWKASTDDGSAFTLSLSWDLDRHVVVMHGKGDDMEFKGFSALEPASDQVNYVGFDNRGAVSKGKWAMEDGELVLRVESRSDRGTLKMAAVFASASGGGLSLRLHQVDQWGNLVTPEQTLLRFKKS